MEVERNNINEVLGVIDLLLLSSGFEERSKTLSFSLYNENIRRTFIFSLDDTYSISEQNEEEIKQKLQSNFEVIVYPKNDNFSTYNIIFKKLSDFFNGNAGTKRLNIVIDTAGFSREILLILIKVISNNEFRNKFAITFTHTSAEKYSDDDDDYIWLTKGIREIRPIIGYTGLFAPSKKLLLVIFNGFEEERTEKIIEFIEPNILILCKPSEEGSINSDLKKISDKKFYDIKAKFSHIIIEEFEFSCKELESTIKLINDIYDKYSNEFNINITPLNNKVSTLAVALSAIRNENLQICYASANQYNIDKKLNPSNYFLVFKPIL